MIRQVYVIMPVGSDPRAAKKLEAIEVGAERAGFRVSLPDYLPLEPSFDLPRMISEIRESHAVIADLTRERPSCYYELGIAEAIGGNVRILAEIGTPIHQCSTRLLVRYYSNLSDLANTVESTLRD